MSVSPKVRCARKSYMIAIFDYGAGNLQSVKNTLDAIGASYELCATQKVSAEPQNHPSRRRPFRPDDARPRRAAASAKRWSKASALEFRFSASAWACRPVQSSEEAPEVRGLGIFEGTVARFPGQPRIPHMGWNQVDSASRTRLLRTACIGDAPFFYFAHSYYVPRSHRNRRDLHYIVPYTAVLNRTTSSASNSIPRSPARSGQTIVSNFIS